MSKNLNGRRQAERMRRFFKNLVTSCCFASFSHAFQQQILFPRQTHKLSASEINWKGFKVCGSIRIF